MANPFEGMERHARRSRPGVSWPTVTIQRSGNLGLNGAAIEVLTGGKEGFVQLFYTIDPPMIGIRSAKEGDPDSYVVKLQSGGNSAVVSGKGVVTGMEIDHKVARRWSAKEVEGGLLVDLSKEGEVVSPGPALKKSGKHSVL